MSRVEQTIINTLKSQKATAAAEGFEPYGYDAYVFTGATGAKGPSVRRTLASMTRRGLLTRKSGYGLRGSAFRYFLPA